MLSSTEVPSQRGYAWVGPTCLSGQSCTRSRCRPSALLIRLATHPPPPFRYVQPTFDAVRSPVKKACFGTCRRFQSRFRYTRRRGRIDNPNLRQERSKGRQSVSPDGPHFIVHVPATVWLRGRHHGLQASCPLRDQNKPGGTKFSCEMDRSSGVEYCPFCARSKYTIRASSSLQLQYAAACAHKKYGSPHHRRSKGLLPHTPQHTPQCL